MGRTGDFSPVRGTRIIAVDMNRTAAPAAIVVGASRQVLPPRWDHDTVATTVDEGALAPARGLLLGLVLASFFWLTVATLLLRG